MLSLCEDLAELFRRRVRLLHKTADIVELRLAYLTKLVSLPTVGRNHVVRVVHCEPWMAAEECAFFSVARAEISHRYHILLRSTKKSLVVTPAVLLWSMEV